MNYKVFHACLGSVDLADVVTKVVKQGKVKELTPMLATTRSDLERRLHSAGLAFPAWFLDTSEIEILASKKMDNVIVFQKGCSSLYEAHLAKDLFEIMILGKDDVGMLESALYGVFTEQLRVLSWHETLMIEQLEEMAGALSTNGKLISKKTMQSAAKDLYDDEFRGKVKKSRDTNTSSKGLAISKNHLHAVQQGLWLEFLTREVMERHCSKVWAGRILGSNEIDVVGTLSDYTVLVECKDRSLGLNDLIVTINKANEVGAEVIIFMTTQPLHANVKRKIPSLRSSIADCASLEVISDKTARNLESQLSKILIKLSVDYPRKWMRWPISKFGWW